RLAQSEDVRPESAGNLFGQGVILGRQEAAVQGTRKVSNPIVVKGMKDPRIDAGPVVNRHDGFLGKWPTLIIPARGPVFTARPGPASRGTSCFPGTASAGPRTRP